MLGGLTGVRNVRAREADPALEVAASGEEDLPLWRPPPQRRSSGTSRSAQPAAAPAASPKADRAPPGWATDCVPTGRGSVDSLGAEAVVYYPPRKGERTLIVLPPGERPVAAQRITDYRLRRSWLEADELSAPLPVGSFIRQERDRLFRTSAAFFATHNGWSVRLIPAYSARARIQVPRVGGVTLRLWGVVRETEAQYVKALVRRVHYLDSRMRGMLLACSFESEKEQELIRRERAAEVDPRHQWSPAWSDPPGRIVACAVLDRLLHGLPLGRDVLFGTGWTQKVRRAEQTGPSANGHSPRFRALLDRGLYWASRFAVEEPYWKLGIGTVLAKHLAHFAERSCLPRCRHIEVIRRKSPNLGDEVVHRSKLAEHVLRCYGSGEETDFLTRAGYQLLHAKPCVPLWSLDPVRGVRVPSRGDTAWVQLYYARSL